MRYEGYELLKAEKGYKCFVDGEMYRFDNAVEWKKFIDKKLCQEIKDR